MMNNKLTQAARQPRLNFEALESRQLLATLTHGFSLHLPQDTAKVVQADLSAKPDILQQPEHGELQFNEKTGELLYLPDSGFTGTDSFQLNSTGQTSQRFDRFVGQYPAQSSWSVQVWEPLYAVPDWVRVQTGSATEVNVLENDYALLQRDHGGSSNEHWFMAPIWNHQASSYEWQTDAANFTIISTSAAEGGTISISADGQSINYMAEEGFVGTDVVTYLMEDADGNQTEATVTFEVGDSADTGHYFVSDAQWQQQQIESWMERYASSITGGTYGVVPAPGGIDFINVIDSIAFGTDLESAARSFSSSDQVEGIQEGDIAKTNGDLLYYVTHDATGSSQFESYLSIIDVSDPRDPTLVGTTGFEQRIHDIFLSDGRAAVVLQQSWNDIVWLGGSVDQNFDVVVLDVTNAEAPSEVYRATIDGSYSDARLIGDELYVVSHSPDDAGLSPWGIVNAIPELNPVSPGNYIDAILNDGGFNRPEIVIESGGQSRTMTIDVNQILDRTEGYGSTQITTFDLNSDSGEPVDIDIVSMNYVQTTYVSNSAIYLFDGNSIIKMDFNDDSAGVEFVADGELKGNLLGQLAVDEFGGYLRVAVTDSTDRSSDVHVISQVDDSLVIVGSVEDIAPGETIYATHFAGDQLFVVTFEQVDPLFVIDLSDPESPTVAGELTVPGFSNYLQLIGDDLLLAVGRDASNGFSGSMQISLFDVSDSSSPELLDRYTFEGGSGTGSPLLPNWGGLTVDHHAITYDSSTGMLALPTFTENRTNSAGRYGVQDSAISLFQLDRENGIQVTGEVSFPDKALRTVIVGEQLLFLSEEVLLTADKSSPTDVLAKMELPTSPSNANPVVKTDPTIEVDPVKIVERPVVVVLPQPSIELVQISEPLDRLNAVDHSPVAEMLVNEFSNSELCTLPGLKLPSDAPTDSAVVRPEASASNDLPAETQASTTDNVELSQVELADLAFLTEFSPELESSEDWHGTPDMLKSQMNVGVLDSAYASLK